VIFVTNPWARASAILNQRRNEPGRQATPKFDSSRFAFRHFGPTALREKPRAKGQEKKAFSPAPLW